MLSKATYEQLPTHNGSKTKAWHCKTKRVCIIFLVFFTLGIGLHRTGFTRSLLGAGRCSKYTPSTGEGLPTHYTLPSGDKIPSVALGLWKAGKNKVGRAVQTAVKSGYQHLDGAWIYGNEAEVGAALKRTNILREDIWLTSKVSKPTILPRVRMLICPCQLWNSFHDPEDVENALDESLSRLGTDYLDLYLIHWSVKFAFANMFTYLLRNLTLRPLALNKDGSVYNQELTDDPYPTWKKLEELVDKGKIRNIGVSNFNIRRIQNLTANPLKYPPAVNQVEINFWFPQPELLAWSKEYGILLEAYSPLGGDGPVGETLSVPVVKEIAAELDITPAQVINSWHVQRGTVVLPKSVTPCRVEENLHSTLTNLSWIVTKLPDELFEKLETAAISHEPKRGVNPSKGWGIDFDIFD
ncbi:NADP-dependent oxidoreductase domain-containing protein [Desarmillaria tabescens]|uniref:NADP-dependent oxidoreductase domain-containing protein n=1 Tax=Armillaria tabescens TaxID=1929756 RepID=A0AA39KHP4_ARMTA|nr:NADP-dependent oxidoreductase domain-containing protein [Desarmillaria tabescens]KAK0460029.1 NADP-dependent oxidoreductase domain-containing protein [Desarmillaria tabescens]